MKKLLTLAAVAGSLILGAAPAQAADRLDGEARLARMLEGRVAGEPVDCVDLRRVRSSSIIDDTAIVYDAGSVVYVQRPRSGADSLSDWDTMVNYPFGGRLCSIDTVRMIDPHSGMLRGIVFLDEFVPYRRVRDGR